ncbi:Holliday junction resolvase YqgF [Desulfarculus baarsii DSM 2075]|uniref:Putative pre-16S rRNA nuclease n=2 Tax=Desulfarculus baarsii TaxID=453230 RepID=E1QKM4_DESB2|nr:Holliday junction resolvase YqgF [Desulfarculus baarsii DSM 2075]
MALDVGRARIGVAVSDEAGLTAQPLCVLRRQGRDEDVRAIGRLAQREGARLIVLGLPLHNDQIGPEAQRVISLGRRLQRRLGLPVGFTNEEDTTIEAHEAMLEADLSRKRRAEVVDKVAAALILRRWLDGMREEVL